MKLKLIFLIGLLVGSPYFLYSQTEVNTLKVSEYRKPLDLPISLSGNYGELRNNHFHSGLDFRVGGVPGAKVFAVADGYISKITCSASGYGNAIYIKHFNGRTTVYGHLLDFSPKLAEYVLSKQYEKQTFAIVLEFDSLAIQVRKGEFIARAGNSGASAGAHLHFEIRDGSTPLNPLFEAGYQVQDTVAPKIGKINIYSINHHNTVPKTSQIFSFTKPIPQVIELPDSFYVAVQASDYQQKNSSSLAVYKYNYYLDSELVFSFCPNKIPLERNRFINSLIDYKQKNYTGRFFVKSWVEPGNALRDNIKAKDNGIFYLKDTMVHGLNIELFDEHGNSSITTFRVKKGTTGSLFARDTIVPIGSILMPWYIPNKYEKGDLTVTLPIGSLYNSMYFTAEESSFKGRRVWNICSREIPIQVPGKISIRSNIPDRLRNKALIASINGEGYYSYLGGEWNGDCLEASLTYFGTYIVLLDSIAPKISPSFKKGANLKKRKSLSFIISDNLSGISEYKVFIDDKWILASFDAKSRRLTVLLDPKRIERNKKHNLDISVTDNRSNINNIKTTFTW